MESLSGVKGDNSVKIIGPDLDELEQLAEQVKSALDDGARHRERGRLPHRASPTWSSASTGRSASWSVSVADVKNVIQTAVGGQACHADDRGREDASTSPCAGRSGCAATSRPSSTSPWTVGQQPGDAGLRARHAADAGDRRERRRHPIGTNVPMPSLCGQHVQRGRQQHQQHAAPASARPGHAGQTPMAVPDPNGQVSAAGRLDDLPRAGQAADRRQVQRPRPRPGRRGGRGPGKADAALFHTPYRAEWSGEFQEMEEAEDRLMFIVPLSLAADLRAALPGLPLLLDALVVLSNVLALSLGGVWALLLTGTNFSISAAVGFISIFGVAIMDGLLLVSYFNHLRAEGLPLREAIMQGAEKRVRPVMMTALTAIFGLLPAAFSTRIGARRSGRWPSSSSAAWSRRCS